MIAFSPGLAQGCFELLRVVSERDLSPSDISSAFSHIGGIPTAQVLEAAQALNWLRSDEAGRAMATSEGARILRQASYEAKLRQALLDYVNIERPAWIQNAPYGRAKVIAFAGGEIAQVFVEADLSKPTDNDTVAFWDLLSALARGLRSDQLMRIGRQGERLTIARETARTGEVPKWVSVDYNEDGYDVLSVVDSDDRRPLSIEVKASTVGIVGSFHLTRNEWERAQSGACHLFHLWDISMADSPAIAVLEPRQVEPHIPINCGEGWWQEATIPFRVFEGEFERGS